MIGIKQLLQRIATLRPEENLFPDNLEAYLEDFIPNQLLKSETLQRAFDISAYEMESIYYEAHSFYETENYDEASTSFRWLVLFNPFVEKYWMGLGASLQMLEKYEKALHAYAMISILEKENPYPHYYAFECYKMLNQLQEATKALEDAYRRTIGKNEFLHLHDEIEKIKKVAICL